MNIKEVQSLVKAKKDAEYNSYMHVLDLTVENIIKNIDDGIKVLINREIYFIEQNIDVSNSYECNKLTEDTWLKVFKHYINEGFAVTFTSCENKEFSDINLINWTRPFIFKIAW